MRKKPSKRAVKKYSPKVRKLLFGSRLPFAPTRSQTPTTAEVELIPQVKADREFLGGEPVGEPELLSAVAEPSPDADWCFGLASTPVEKAADIHEAKQWREVLGAAPAAEGPKMTTLDELSPREREHLLRTVRVTFPEEHQP